MNYRGDRSNGISEQKLPRFIMIFWSFIFLLFSLSLYNLIYTTASIKTQPFPSQDSTKPSSATTDEKQQKESELVKKVTFVIKTHDRPQSLDSLIRSIRIFYPTVRILVADDGGNQIPRDDVEYHKLDYDIGLSASRNFLIDTVDTEYFLTLDDDFIFLNYTLVETLLEVLETTNVSIASGSLVLPDGTSYDYAGLIEISDKVLRLRNADYGNLKKFPNCRLVDIVANFFMAKTEAIRQIRWDSEFKLGEHQDFFIRVKESGITVACCKNVSVYHRQVHSDEKYKAKRQREYMYLKQMLKKHNLESFQLFSGLTYVRYP